MYNSLAKHNILSDQSKCYTKLAVYNGLDTKSFKDKQNFTGSIINQIDDTLNYDKLLNTTSAIITGEAKREERASYPVEAIREAIINAFAHRDYSQSADIRIEFFDNWIEVHSPGVTRRLSMYLIK